MFRYEGKTTKTPGEQAMRVFKQGLLLTIALALLLAQSSALAVNSKAGTYAYSFLKIPVGAKAPAMGGAYTGLSDDESALYYNPAGITQIAGSAVSASYNNYLTDIQGGFLSYITSWGDRGKIGFAFNYLNFGDISKTDSTGSVIGDFGGGDLSVSITAAMRWPSESDDTYDEPEEFVNGYYGRKYWSGLSVGLTAKFVYESIDDYSSDALAVDMGMVYGLKDNRTRMGVSLSNLGFQMKSMSSGHKDSMPAVLRAGFGHQLKAAPFVMSADVVKPFDNDPYVAAGMNFTRLYPLEIRAGYSTLGQDFKTESSKDNWAGLSFGIGLKLSKLVFDYAFVPFADLGNSHRIGISSRW